LRKLNKAGSFSLDYLKSEKGGVSPPFLFLTSGSQAISNPWILKGRLTKDSILYPTHIALIGLLRKLQIMASNLLFSLKYNQGEF